LLQRASTLHKHISSINTRPCSFCCLGGPDPTCSREPPPFTDISVLSTQDHVLFVARGPPPANGFYLVSLDRPLCGADGLTLLRLVSFLCSADARKSLEDLVSHMPCHRASNFGCPVSLKTLRTSYPICHVRGHPIPDAPSLIVGGPFSDPPPTAADVIQFADYIPEGIHDSSTELG
jgi:hypothetical protein